LPGLEVGDTIHYRLNRRQFKPVIAHQIYGSVLGQYDIPIHSYVFTVTTPAKIRFQWLIKAEVEGCVVFRESHLPAKEPKTIRSWTFSQVPQIVPEPQMPSFRRVAMRLLYSTLPDWPAIATWYDNLVAKKLIPGAELKKKVNQLIDGKTGDDEKMAALFYYVARKIRYLGVSGESERPGFEPHDVNLTFERRHGVCRDKAALLVSMLRLAGFKAAAVLIRVGDKLDREIPLPYFNHAIVAVLDDNGKALHFLDPTSETSRQFLPDYERECSYLIADSQNGNLALTPPVPPEENSFILEIIDELSPAGELGGTITVSCTGFNDTMMRSIMMNQSRKEQENFLKRLFLSQYSSLELTALDWSDPADRSVSFTFSGKFSVMALAPLNLHSPQKTPGAGLLQPLAFMKNPGLLDRWILKRADMTKRRYPLKLGYTYTTILNEHLSFSLPPKVLRLPVKTEINNKIFSQNIKFSKVKPGKLLIERRFTLKKTEVEPQYYQLLTNLQNRNQKRSLTPIEIEWQQR
ncbi:MAG: transglutaminase domain-containing protein, partial [Pseudomonadota bacterium]|nr:transglutaminase domain-containing protein [Pseudomonadota bacterium]